MTAAGYLEGGTANASYGTSYNYDKHGNMTNLVRNGRTGTSTFGTVDNLSMSYAGNQLIKADDTGTTVTLSASMDFKNNSTAAKEYFYDLNGNLTQDLNKGITGITYNFLNLPQSVTINNTLGQATNTYTYAADGRKLRANIGSKQTDYVGNVIYEGGALKRILVDGGYIEGGAYYFYLTDHLGNNRVVANASGGIVQTNHYYPFGMSFAEGVTTSGQPYKYNGKELDTERGLNLYDYSARLMDPALGRFSTVDPKSEKYYGVSPYVYCNSNPMKYIDPTGMFYDDYFNQYGKYLGTDNSSTDYVRVMDDSQWSMNSNGDGTIDPEIGVSVGALHSESTINTEASLGIYQHYNSTGMPLDNTVRGAFKKGSTGMITQSIKGNPVRVDVDVAGFKEAGYSDHSNEIKNFFVHEGQHVGDMKLMGYNLKGSPSDKMGEARAIQTQMSHSTYSGTGSDFKAGINEYVKVLKLQLIVLPSIQKPFK
ncbi:RHS repeat-associated core domain-containing protein [uncultured Bacteroides sp.]|uniref:RHS repeat-associated core domain-containing protein n=1 Tax=uncultured Bacteroides sp. TaxID=162156 RepID=UPI002AA73697|nr:RHS repeat-associated core domain-containing protein [uncultured Bacteroides sp.]